MRYSAEERLVAGRVAGVVSRRTRPVVAPGVGVVTVTLYHWILNEFPLATRLATRKSGDRPPGSFRENAPLVSVIAMTRPAAAALEPAKKSTSAFATGLPFGSRTVPA